MPDQRRSRYIHHLTPMSDSTRKKGLISHSNTLVALLDAIVSVIASLLAVLSVRWLNDSIFGFQHFLWLWLLASACISVAGIYVTGTYKIVIRHSTFKSISKLFLLTIFKELALFCCVLLGLLANGNRYIGMMTVWSDLGTTLVSLILVRLLIITIYESMTSSMEDNVRRLRVMVYGTDNKSLALVIRLESSPHYDVVGFLSDDPSRRGQVIYDRKVYCFSSAKDITKLKASAGLECVLFARDADASAQKGALVKYCADSGVHMLLTPTIDSGAFGTTETKAAEVVVDEVVIAEEFISDGMGSFSRNAKRIFDCFASGILLIIFSPLFLICYIAVKLEDHGPAIFKQERIGRFGRPFYIYKFRSMRLDAESFGPALYSGDDDPRLTKVGKFLRQHHLDELPQLWNVFNGDMAFIGPRPERKFYIDQILEKDPRYRYLYQIRPGVTSYATLYNGYTDTLEKMLRRLEYDLYYLRHRSWWFDIKILALTFMSIVFGKKF